MKRKLLLLLAALLPIVASAYDAKIDGIYYNFISGDEAEVTYREYQIYNYSDAYKGAVVIPASITYNGRTYSVTSIGKNAFYGCSSLTSIAIPNSVTSIGEQAFEYCSGLTSIAIPNSVTSIGWQAFSGCSGLTSIAIPNSVTTIGSNAFCNCYGLTSVTIGNGVTTIGSNAFSNCTSLTSVTIPNSVTSIGSYAFSNCTSLTSVTIGNGVTTIGEQAFEYCSSLTKVIVPDIAAWCSIWFRNLESNPLYYAEHIFCDEETEITDLIIPDGVTSISDLTFYGCSGLTSISIPNSVTSIGRSAFYGCSGLTSITIPNSVTSIGSNAFEGTAWYNNQPDGLIYADKFAYKYKGTMPAGTQITIAEGTLRIADNAFSGCSGLTSITIPNSVTSIGRSAFNNCNSLKKVIVPDIAAWCRISFNDYDSNPLYYAHHLYSYETTEITNLVIPDDVTSIGAYAFRNCYGLTSVTIGNGVTTIGKNAFNGCSSLTSVTIGNGVTSIGRNAFYGCSSLTSVTIPNSVTSIGEQAFYGCSGLTSVTIGNGVTSIGGWAFYKCTSLTSVTIGNSVTSIDDYAFFECYRLTSINSLNPVPPTCPGTNTFKCNPDYRNKNEIYNYATLHVPMGSKEDYSSAYEWRSFNKIKEDMQIDGNVFYANLVVQMGADGYIRQAVKADQQFTIFIGSYGNNRINTVTFNGEDVTSDVVDGYYTTPEIKGESVLSISYEIDTAVNSLSLKDVKVSGYDGEIRISNIDEPSDVCVYSTDGKLVGNINAALGSTCLQVQGEQLYLVKVGNKTYKVTMP